MTSSENLGSQFNCPSCGTPQYSLDGYTPHNHNSVSIDSEAILAISNAAKTSADMDEVERTRKVDLNNRADLLDHLASDNGHMIGRFSQYRSSYNDDLGSHGVPGVRDHKSDDFELTTEELKSVHNALHKKYDDEPHVTIGNEHYHL